MRLFAGEFKEVNSFISNGHWGYNVEDNAYALMRTEKGVVAMLNSSATQWRHRFHLDINFEKGSLILGGILSGSKSYGAETLTVGSANPEDDLGDPKEVTTRYNTDPSWYSEIKEFADNFSPSPEIKEFADNLSPSQWLVECVENAYSLSEMEQCRNLLIEKCLENARSSSAIEQCRNLLQE